MQFNCKLESFGLMDGVIENLPFTLDDGIGSKARIGLVALASDYTIEHEFREVMRDPDYGLFTARIQNEMQVTPQTLADMEKRIATTVDLILPGEKLDVVAYGCTSASMVMGEETVFKQIRKTQPKAKCTTPATAAFAAFNAFGAKNIAVLTPYRRDVNEIVKAYIENAGFNVSVFGSFNEEQDPIVARIDAKSLSNAVEALIKDVNVDMVFVSCTSVRLMDAVKALEEKHDLPFTSSNHALCWHSMRLSGNTQSIPQRGRLYEKQL